MRTAIVPAIVAIILLFPPGAAEEVDRGTATLEELVTWQDPSGGPVSLSVSPGGAHLLVLGGSSLVRVLDRDLDPVGQFEPPLELEGAEWSSTGDGIIVWGHEQGNETDDLLFFDFPSLEPDAGAINRTLVPLRTVDRARFYADDQVLIVCGRDANGTSRVAVLDGAARRLHRDFEVPGNATILWLESDLRDALAVTETGLLLEISGTDWTLKDASRSVPGTPTAVFLQQFDLWTVGDENGKVRAWVFEGVEKLVNITAERGPVEGVVWMVPDFHYLLVAFPGMHGGSTLQTWRTRAFTDEPGEPPFLIAETNLTGEVSTMEPIDLAKGTIAMAFTDGAVRTYHANFTAPWFPPPNVESVDNGGDGNGEDGDDGWGGSGLGIIAGLVVAIVVLTALYLWLRKGRS